MDDNHDSPRNASDRLGLAAGAVGWRDSRYHDRLHLGHTPQREADFMNYAPLAAIITGTPFFPSQRAGHPITERGRYIRRISFTNRPGYRVGNNGASQHRLTLFAEELTVGRIRDCGAYPTTGSTGQARGNLVGESCNSSFDGCSRPG